MARLGEESSRAVAAIQASVAQKKGAVLDLLLGHVTTVKLQK